MTKALTHSCSKRTGLSALAGFALCLQALPATAQSLTNTQTAETVVEKVQSQPHPAEQRAKVTHDAYILGPGDRLKIQLLDLPELSGEFTIGPDGTLYLPRLRTLQVEGLTIEELRLFLTEQFLPYIREPKIFITPSGYRPVRVYVGGEVARPGYYTIRDAELVKSPTLFDALRAARGVTPYSKLNSVQITRKRPLSQGRGKIRTKVNFLRLISDGNEDVNIRLYDGDAIFVSKSQDVLRDQLLAASRTNLSPDFINVFVSGRVNEPGTQRIPQGTSLNQAIASAGGPKLLRGKVEFLRFTPEGATDRRIFAYDPERMSGDYRNPILMSGDIIRVNESLLNSSLNLLNELTAPGIGIYSIYSIFGN